MALFEKRILKEIKAMQTSDEMEIINIELPSIFIKYNAPKDTIYEGESFKIKITIPKRYPIDAPEIIFIDNIPINEHVYSNGHICVSILYDNWTPAYTLHGAVMNIISMIAGAKSKKKPVNDKMYCYMSKNKSPKEFKWVYDD